MKQYRVSQGEHWFRNYYIVADSEKGALEKYQKFLDTQDQNLIDMQGEPEFLADMTNDIQVELHFEEPAFWVQDLLDENVKDLQNSIDDLVPIVSERDGGIIAYALGENHAVEICSALNKGV